MFGGLDFNTFQSTPPWPVVAELEKQYEVVQIAAQDSIQEKVDALVIVMPSSLSQEEMNHVQDLMARGTPTLLIDDPLPVFDPMSPSEGGASARFIRNRGPQPKPRAASHLPGRVRRRVEQDEHRVGPLYPQLAICPSHVRRARPSIRVVQRRVLSHGGHGKSCSSSQIDRPSGSQFGFDRWSSRAAAKLINTTRSCKRAFSGWERTSPDLATRRTNTRSRRVASRSETDGDTTKADIVSWPRGLSPTVLRDSRRG
jgi:hypothetical protein